MAFFDQHTAFIFMAENIERAFFNPGDDLRGHIGGFPDIFGNAAINIGGGPPPLQF